MRIALKLAYIGTKYHGSQTQPGVPTIEDELFRALKRLNLFEDRRAARYSAAGRTDRGVHALSQVVAFDLRRELSEAELKMLPRMITSMLPDDIWVLAAAEVPNDFNARRDATLRRYKYFLLNEGFDVERMQEAAEVFLGRHDFRNFTVKPQGNTVREVKKIEIHEQGRFLVIDIAANAFVHGMIRKIASALKRVGWGKCDVMWLERLLRLEIEDKIELAPPFALVLWEVHYDKHALSFEHDEYVCERATAWLSEEILRHLTLSGVFEEFRREFLGEEG
ncbi:tRNA pseudouridine(38-40) synthase TruA [Candidatus Alkanophaga liquidiphilum]